MTRLRLLRDERGFSLVFTLLTLLVTSVTMTAAIQYTTSNSSAANRSEGDQIAYALAEAGLANGAAVLSKPENNALSQSTLPSEEPDPNNPAHANYIIKYEGGTVKFWGVLTGSQWLMHGLGIVTDPTGKTAVVRRQVTSTIKIQPTLKQTLNSNAWNYLFAKNTANSCDVTLDGSVQIATSMYILGDLCMDSSSQIMKATSSGDTTNLYVGERIQFLGSYGVGNNGNKINEARIGLGCRVGSSGAYTNPCTSSTRVWADSILSGAIAGTGPVADFSFWYTNAKPGPKQFCSSSSNFSSTAFESSGSTTKNNSAGSFNLTPGSSYTCRYYDVAPNQTDLLGELSWNASTRTLTVKGAIYIDGSAYADNGLLNRYTGLATLYLSGTFTIDGSTQLCGAITGTNCDFTSWDPNANNLGIIADGNDGDGRSIRVLSSTRLQASLYATNAIFLDGSVQFDGPAVAGTFHLLSSVQTYEFPTVTTVPVGWPGNPTVYAEPQPPSNYSG